MPQPNPSPSASAVATPPVAVSLAAMQIPAVDAVERVLQQSALMAQQGNYPDAPRELAPSGVPYGMDSGIKEITGEGGQTYWARKDINQAQDEFVFGFFNAKDIGEGKFAAGLARMVTNHPDDPAAKHVPKEYFGHDGRVRSSNRYLCATRRSAFVAYKNKFREQRIAHAKSVMEPKTQNEGKTGSEIFSQTLNIHSGSEVQ